MADAVQGTKEKADQGQDPANAVNEEAQVVWEILSGHSGRASSAIQMNTQSSYGAIETEPQQNKVGVSSPGCCSKPTLASDWIAHIGFSTVQ